MARPAVHRLIADRYVLTALLGRGGTGVLWRAQDVVLGREVAVKEVVFPPAMAVAELGGQIAGALEAAHQAGIVHRDVKPGNVMVPASGLAKLADFGIASLQGDPQLTSTGLVIGSPAYMAPEQARGEASGPPVDFWGLGATMYYAVEGAPPFDRGTSIATLAAVVNDRPRVPARAGPLTDLLTALLAKDPAARPSGPKVRAWLHWLLVVAPSSPITVEASRRSTRAGAPGAPPGRTAVTRHRRPVAGGRGADRLADRRVPAQPPRGPGGPGHDHSQH